jgi:hypothetical protein
MDVQNVPDAMMHPIRVADRWYTKGCTALPATGLLCTGMCGEEDYG